MQTLKFSEFISEGFATSTPNSNAIGAYFTKLLAIRDQAHVFHWQTRSFARHEAFGEFYETFLTNTDALAEMIMGIVGRPTFGEAATILLSDLSTESIQKFLEAAYPIFGDELEAIVDDDTHEEIFDQARIILAELDKLKYLLTLK